MTPKSTTTQRQMPAGLRQVAPGQYLIQLTRGKARLTKRFRGTEKQALRALEEAKLELGARLAEAKQTPPSPPTP
jgi:hypothetical protein